jgi:hypothetical protein
VPAAGPKLEEASPEAHEYRVWVLVPSVTVLVYPEADDEQQPMLQFTGDRERLDRGWGQMSLVAAPDEFVEGQTITFFDDVVLWEDSLTATDKRSFTLWLRENNKTAPTRSDEVLRRFSPVVAVVDEVAGLVGAKIKAQRLVNISRTLYKELRSDHLILEWTCPWRRILDAARPRLPAGRREVVLRAEVVSTELVDGEPTARLTALFVVQRLEEPTLSDVGRRSVPGLSP